MKLVPILIILLLLPLPGFAHSKKRLRLYCLVYPVLSIIGAAILGFVSLDLEASGSSIAGHLTGVFVATIFWYGLCLGASLFLFKLLEKRRARKAHAMDRLVFGGDDVGGDGES